MKSSKKQQNKRSSGIKGKHTRRKGQPLVLTILLVSVAITMIVLNQWQKRSGNKVFNTNSKTINERKASGSEFKKEGELEFFDAQDSILLALEIEIADDDYQTERGLMYRRSMKENQGMLFIFPDMQERSFWMKNTYIPLDIIYLDNQKKVLSIAENTLPRSTESIPSGYPAKYVVEVNAGMTARFGIKKGTSMDFKRTY